MSNKKKHSGLVVPDKGLIIGTKNPKTYKKGSVFSTENEALYNDLVKRKKIK